MSNSSSTTITFSEEEQATSSVDAADISFSLKSEDNGDSNTFYLVDIARIRFYNPQNKVPTFVVTKGSLSLEAFGFLEDTHEFVIFRNTKSENLSGFPIGAISHEWIGVSGGPPSFSGRKVSLADDTIGVLRVNYKMEYSLYKLTSGGIVGPGLVFATTNDGGQADITVDFEPPEGSGEGSLELVKTIINVKDYCTDMNVSAANVSVSGNGFAVSGTTDPAGNFDAGFLSPGKYNLSITALNYIASGVDALHNDSFTIPSG